MHHVFKNKCRNATHTLKAHGRHGIAPLQPILAVKMLDSQIPVTIQYTWEAP